MSRHSTSRGTGMSVLLHSALIGAGLVFSVMADESDNPYLAIVDRNPFGLKPLPPPPPPEPEQPSGPPPASKVVLTGITSMFGPESIRALLEIEEQDPSNKQKVTKKPVLKVGETEGSVTILSINIEKNIVRIKNGEAEMDVTFEKPKSTPAPGTPAPAMPMLANATVNPAAPIVINRDGREANSGRVSLMGGNSPGNPGAMASAATGTSSDGANVAYNALGMPVRPLRSDQLNQPTKNAVTPEEGWLHMEAMREAMKSRPLPVKGADPIPLPPTPYTELIQAEHNAAIQEEQNGGRPPFPPMPNLQLPK